MSLVSDLLPLNVAAEKEKFLADRSYQPQFIYRREFTTKLLTRFGLPTAELMTLATAYLQTHQPPLTDNSPKLTPLALQEQLTDLMTSLKLAPLPIIYQGQSLSRASLRARQLVLRVGDSFTTDEFRAILYHEILTHYLRAYNQDQQIFPAAKPTVFLPTEEGLAIFNGLWAKTNGGEQRPSGLLMTVCRRYLLAAWAQELDFAALAARLRQEWQFSLERSWQWAMRAKRGLTDTAQKGGFTKDLIYLTGFLQIIDLIATNPIAYRELYWGRIAWTQLSDLRLVAKTTKIVYPPMVEQLDRLVSLAALCKLEVATADSL